MVDERDITWAREVVGENLWSSFLENGLVFDIAKKSKQSDLVAEISKLRINIMKNRGFPIESISQEVLGLVNYHYYQASDTLSAIKTIKDFQSEMTPQLEDPVEGPVDESPESNASLPAVVSCYLTNLEAGKEPKEGC